MRPVAFLLLLASLAQGDRLPAFDCETLSGEHLTMPAAAQGQPALFVVGFTRASGEQTSFWAKRIPKDLVPAYSVAVLEGVPGIVRRLNIHAIKSGVPKERYGRFLIVEHNEKELKDAAGFQTSDEAYLFLVDSAGEIQWRFHGPFAHTALKDLEERLRSIKPKASGQMRQ